MNKLVEFTAALLVLLLISQPVSAVNPEYRIEDINSRLDDLGISYKPSGFVVSEFHPSVTEINRIGIVRDDVAEYKISINVGPGEYDSITLTNYVKEKSPWNTRSNKNLIILPGQALTEVFYSDMAIYYAQKGCCVYVLDRRETNVPVTETDFSFMADWTIDECLKDTYYGVGVSRIHTALLNHKSAEIVEVTAIGHSHGALILTAYEASEYDDLSSCRVDKIIPVDIIIRYDPQYSELIENQAQEFGAISESIEGGTYNENNMAIMMQMAYLASTNPEGISPVQPGLTNRQLFRLMASQTYMFKTYPYTPDYHYWSGDLNGLYYVDEDRLLYVTLNGGAVPYTPKSLDQYMAGLMGNVEGYEIDSSRIDSPVLYVGLGGGFGEYGSWWYENEVVKTNDEITSIIWNDQGHGSIALDYNSPELWAEINKWLENNQ